MNMITLPESEYIYIKEKLKEAPSFVYAVLDKMISGDVHVDSANCNSILIGTSSGIFYVMGDENNKNFNDFLIELYLSKVNEQARFTLFSSSLEWDEMINQLCGNNEWQVNQYRRYAFLFNKKKYREQKSPLSQEYTIERTSELHMKQSSLFGCDYYEEYWGGVFRFLENGFGYSIIHNGKVVSECTSIFHSKQYAEIDIASNNEYRGKGLAFRCAQAFIDHCMTEQLIPRWDCDVNNTLSIKLGEKLGFEIAKEYSIYTRSR